MLKYVVLTTVLAATGCIAVVGNTTKATVSEPLASVHEGRVTVHANSVEWRAGPASLPAGIEVAVLEGDPTTSGPFTMRMRLPRNTLVQPHYHPSLERLTVISGRMHLGMGESVNMASAATLTAGSFSLMPPGMRHFAHTLEETVVQVTGNGPWQIIYVRSTDDPRNK